MKKWQRTIEQAVEEGRRNREPASLDDLQNEVSAQWRVQERERRDEEGLNEVDLRKLFRFIFEHGTVTVESTMAAMEWDQDETEIQLEAILIGSDGLLMRSGDDGFCFTHAGMVFCLRNDKELHGETIEKLGITEVTISVEQLRELRKGAIA